MYCVGVGLRHIEWILTNDKSEQFDIMQLLRALADTDNNYPNNSLEFFSKK